MPKKRCTKCNRLLSSPNFECVMARGKLTQRSRCRDCMHAYYRSRSAIRALQHKRKRRPGETFRAVPARAGFIVIGEGENLRTRVMSIHPTEQDADRDLAKLINGE